MRSEPDDLRCPWCGLRVHFSENFDKVGHELPACSGFVEKMAELGLAALHLGFFGELERGAPS
jgi:hypothetical protein